MTRTFNVLDAGCSAFISYFTTANFQKYITYNITLFKTFGNITICSEKLSNYEFESSRDFPKIGCWLPIKKHLQHSRGLFEVAKQTSSAGAASAIRIWYSHPYNFWRSEGFGLSRQLVPSDSEGNNCASEATQILRLNNEQNLRYLKYFGQQKVTWIKK